MTVVRHTETLAEMNHSRLNYGLYALFLKQGEGCSICYGREKYDYQEGTVVSFKPGFAHTISSVISHADFDWTEIKFDHYCPVKI